MSSRADTSARIAVIGAGVAGITCARDLKQKGFEPQVFEKSRGLGGRLATRRIGDGIAFDHGAQYITARAPSFRAAMAEAEAIGAAATWQPSDYGLSASREHSWIVGAPAMNALVKPAAKELDIRLACRITAVAQDQRGWWLSTADHMEDEPFDVVISTVPAPQSATLLTAQTDMREALSRVTIAPCWALMVSFDTPLDLPFDVWRSRSGELSWIGRNSSKPGRVSSRDCWVIHASPDWSQDNLELDSTEIAERMIDMLPAVLGKALPPVSHASAHRWRYALTTAPLGQPYLSSKDGTLFLGGDWCLGGRVEYAFESGREIARAVIHSLAP